MSKLSNWNDANLLRDLALLGQRLVARRDAKEIEKTNIIGCPVTNFPFTCVALPVPKYPSVSPGD